MTRVDRNSARLERMVQRCAVTGFDNTAQELPVLCTAAIVNKEWLRMRTVGQMLWCVLNRDAGYEKKLIVGEVIRREHHSIKMNKLEN